MSKAELKSIGAAPAEVMVPEKELEVLRETVKIEDNAMAVLGRAYLEEARARKALDRAIEAIRVARESALHAQQHRTQVHKTVIQSLDVGDGSWDLDLEAGKLVRTDGQS